MSLAFPIERPLTRAIGSSVRWDGRRRWTPAALFAQGQQGVWYEPKPEYLFQDAAGTVPVTADGDPKGYEGDLSGNGLPMTQSTSSHRPLYRTDGNLHWNSFDGVDDKMRSTLFVNPPVTLAVAMRLEAGSVFMYGFGGGYLADAAGYGVGRGDSGNYFAQARAGGNIHAITSNQVAGEKAVLVLRLDSDGTMTLTDSGGTKTISTTVGGLAQNAGCAIGRPSTASGNVADFNGEFYGGLVVGRFVADSEVSQIREYLASRAGVSP